MKVTFRSKELQQRFEKSAEAFRAYGEAVGRKYIQRIDIIMKITNLDELIRLPGLVCHPLKGKLKGCWAMRLNGFYRLIFSVGGDKNDVIRIEEVSKHFGD